MAEGYCGCFHLGVFEYHNVDRNDPKNDIVSLELIDPEKSRLYPRNKDEGRDRLRTAVTQNLLEPLTTTLETVRHRLTQHQQVLSEKNV